jgi:hypothetical protein
MDVPLATLAVQLKVEDPIGGLRTNVWPPGMIPCVPLDQPQIANGMKKLTRIVTGCTAWS